MFKKGWVVLMFTAILWCGYPQQTTAQDTLTIMYYNVLNFPGSTPGRITNFRTTAAYIQPDILLVTELLDETGAETLLQNGLNVFGKTNYQRADFTDGPDTDNMLFYNADKVALYSQDTIETALRLINEYILYSHSGGIVSGPDTSFFYFYIAHLKASQGSDNEQKRLAEVLKFKQHINTLPDAENIFFGGDFNLYDASEPAYYSLINDGIYPLTDPLPAGSWHNDASFALWHTQSTRTDQFGGGASGGMDDRFDFILFSNDVANGTNNVTYVPGSCQAPGNDGNHFNLGLLDPPFNPTVPDSVLNALYYMSDHLPVICRVAVAQPAISDVHRLSLKVFLEGPFTGSEMTTTLQPNIPLAQPFDQSPWNYSGNEAVAQIVNPDIVDWVLVELRSSDGPAGNATSDQRLWEQACFLLKDGTLVDTSQSNLPLVNVNLPGNIYTVIRHRNHLDIMASNPMEVDADTCAYEFFSGPDQFYGSADRCKELSPGIWGMIAGDANADNMISVEDIQPLWENEAGQRGYLNSDANLDGNADNRDKNDLIILNLGRSSEIPQ